MRFFILLAIAIASGCAPLDSNLQNALAFGDIKVLNEYSAEIDKHLLIRLYSAPIHKESCFVETQGACKLKYFISVSTFDEYPETNIYRLQNEGEITEVNWINTSDVDSAELNLIFNQFSSGALKNNSALINQQKIVNIKVNPSEILETVTLNQ